MFLLHILIYATLEGTQQELLKKYERELNEIVEKFQETSHLLQEFHTLNGWSLVKKKNEVSTFYRHEEGDLMHSIRLEGVISCPIFDVLAVVYEVDLYPEWWPHIKECFTLKQITNYRKIVYMRGELPWPLYNRDIVRLLIVFLLYFCFR